VSIYLTDPVSRLRESLLPVLASWIFGDAVSVQSTSASRHRAQVVGRSRTILVDGNRCSLLGLFLAAGMLHVWLRDPVGRRVRQNASPTFAMVRDIAARARQRLIECFPSLEHLPPQVWRMVSTPPELPEMRWASALVDPQPIVPVTPQMQREHPELLDDTKHQVTLPDCDMEGAGSTFERFAEGIRAGTIALQHLPELPDVPYVAVSVRVGGRHDAPAGTTEKQHSVRTGAAKEAGKMYAECVRKSTEGVPVDNPPDAAAWSGLEIDPARLCDARIAIKTRREFPLFLQSEDPLTQFDPAQHRVVLYGDLARGQASVLEGAPSSVVTSAMAQAFERLGLRTEWHCFLDYVVPGPKGRKVVLHLDFLVKGELEPWGALAWDRFGRLQGAGLKGVGEGGVFPPLHLSRVLGRLERMVDGMEDPRWVHPVVLCSPGMRAMGYVERAGVRWATAMEGMMRGLEGLGKVKPFLWLPREVKDGARRGSLLAKATGDG
jgi:hypothetical protein